MSKPNKITIDDVVYVREDSVTTVTPNSKIKIVILPRGWNMIGYFSKDGSQCKLEKAAVIRRWGTTKGLGQLALEGALKGTILDKCPLNVEFHELIIVATIDCVEGVWQKIL